MTQLRHLNSDLDALGVDLAIIGNGAPTFIPTFRDKTGFQGAIFTDPTRRAYRAMSLTNSVRSSVNAKSIRRAFRAYASGNRQSKPVTKPQGDAWQQGGVFLFLPDGEIAYRHLSRYAGDHPSSSDILTAARSAVAR